ncbi:MAG: hypothetical protein WCY19_01530 [Candidatus Gastranaerophilaceae bacterium]
MGNGISDIAFNGGYNVNQYSRDMENVAKYALGATLIEQEEGPFSGMGSMLVFGLGIEGFKGISWLNKSYKNAMPVGFENLAKDELKLAKKMANPLRNGGWKTAEGYTAASNNIKSAWAAYATKANEQTEAFKAAGGFKSVDAYKLALTNQRVKSITDMIPTAEKMAKLSPKTQAVYTRVQRAIKLVSENPSHKELLMKVANKQLANANYLAHVETAKTATGFFAKLKNCMGITTIGGWVKKLAKKSPTTAKLLKYGKGNGAFLAIMGAIELFTQVIPSFSQLGAGKGTKQLAKSTAKTVANVGGWVAGAALGAKAGAIIGTPFGGPIGTLVGGLIGAACGVIGGFIGSWAATKATEKIVGKNELDIAKEKQAEEITQEARKNPEAAKQLMAAAEQKLQSEGKESEDAKIAFGSLQNLVKFAQTQANEKKTENKSAQDNTSLTGNAATNLFAAGSKSASGQMDYMNEDFMALGAGLV